MQFQKDSFPILVTPLGKLIDSKNLQPANAPDPISVTLSGIIIFFRLWHPSKAWLSILVILFGILTVPFIISILVTYISYFNKLIIFYFHKIPP